MIECSPTRKRIAQKLHIDVDLIPIKLYYFLLFGAIGGVMPFLPILGKQLGLSATAVGIIYTIQPFSILIAKTFLGVLTDRLQNFKLIMIVLTIASCISFASILLITPIQQETLIDGITLKCINGVRTINIAEVYNKTCGEILTHKNLTCDFRFATCMNSDKENANTFSNETFQNTSYVLKINLKLLQGVDNFLFYNSQAIEVKDNQVFAVSEPLSNPVALNVSFMKSPCQCQDSVWSFVSCASNLTACMQRQQKIHKTVYETVQFWTFASLVIVGGSCTGALFTLSDAACYEVLGERAKHYGKQRLWGTASWGIVSMLAGYLNGLASAGKDETDYAPGFYLMLLLFFLNAIMLFKVKLTKANFTSTICKDVGRIFASSETITFGIAVFIVGGLSGLLWSYEFWYLQNLGASQFLLGFFFAVQCLLAEVPFFFISGFLIRKLGHFYCLVATFAAFSLRYVLYFFLTNPWYAILIGLLHGQTFGNFYATMTSFACTKALPGTEATMLGVLGGLFEGLGVAAGSLLGGLGFDHIGGNYTFLSAGVLSAVCAVIFVFVRCALNHSTHITENAAKSPRN